MLIHHATPWVFKMGAVAAISTLIFNWSFRFVDDVTVPTSVAVTQRTPLEDITLFSPRFSCGGGPFSNTMASLVSFPCDVEEIHDCCVKHDHCYDSKTNQTTCDETFCNCLAELPYQSAFCDIAAHKGLCLATHVFGHLFYEEENENETKLID